MIFIPTASCDSTNSRSNRSINTSRFPGCKVYRLSSTTGQHVPVGESEPAVIFVRSDIFEKFLQQFIEARRLIEEDRMRGVLDLFKARMRDLPRARLLAGQFV